MSRTFAQQLVGWLDELGAITDEPGRLTRTFLSPAMRRANARVGEWMSKSGLSVREDSVGNLIGRLDTPHSNARTLLLGSHLDTVVNAGRFDGPLGVLLPIAALAELKRRKVVLPFVVEVLGFSEEEGVRFASAYLGSKGFTGQLRAGDLSRRDASGMSVRTALETFNGRRFVPPRSAHRRDALLGYLEVHIEQGPQLEVENAAVGVVTAIAGQTRGWLTFRGKAGHAGTTPMRLRRDALAGAAEFMIWAETLARRSEPLVATVGVIAAEPGAPNVIPGQVRLSLDVRHPRDASRMSALRKLLAEADGVARRRGLRCTWERTQDGGAMMCSADLTAVLRQSVRAVQGACPALVSGAGHDAVVMSAVAPTAMLFVRCRDGLSHHPNEYASRADIAVAFRVVVDFLERMAHRIRAAA